MKAISGKEFVRLLERRGWHRMRITGSHYIYAKQGIEFMRSRALTPGCLFPSIGNKPLKIGLQRHLMKLAGISEQAL